MRDINSLRDCALDGHVVPQNCTSITKAFLTIF